MINLVEEVKSEKFGAVLKAIGVGGAGGNAVNSMITENECDGVTFYVANTDAQALEMSLCEHKIQIGSKVTKGLGAGANPEVGRRAAEEDIEQIMEYIKDADILFLTGGLGGGTASGALPVIAQAAREKGILTVAIVTKPFEFEGRRRSGFAQEAISILKPVVDTLIVVPNQKLIEVADPKISMLDAFGMSNGVLRQAIFGISNIIKRPGLINVDFADVRSVMRDMGLAIMGTGRCSGEDRAQQAAINAISSPLLEEVSIEGAKGVLINITGNVDLGLHEIHAAARIVHDLVNPDANIILGSVIDESMGDEVMVTVIATGFEERTLFAQSGYSAHRPIYNTSSVKYARAESIGHAEPVAAQPQPVHHQAQPVMVKEVERPEKAQTVAPRNTYSNVDPLDIPAFMRNKQRETEQDAE